MRVLKTFIFIFLALQVNAQRFSWGVPVKHDKLEFEGAAMIDRYLLEENENGMTRLRVEKAGVTSLGDVTLEKYDANLELTKTVEVLDVTTTIRLFEKVIVGNDKFYVFYAVSGTTEKTNTLKVQSFDFDGEALGEPKVLDVIKNTKAIARGYFEVAASENGEHFALVSMPVFVKKTNESIVVKTFDADFNEVFSKKFTLAYPSKRFLFNTPYIMNDGTMFMHKHQKVKKVGVVREMYVLDKEAKKLKANKIKLNGGYAFSMIDSEMLQRKNGNFVYAGLIGDEGTLKAPKGVGYLEYDNTGKLVREVIKEFKNAPKLGITGLKLKKAELLPNGDVLFLADQLDESSVSTGSDVNNRVYGYKGQDIYVARLSGDDLVWSQVIERKLIETKSDRGRLLEFAWMYDEEGDNLIVLYNDMQDRYQKTLRGGNYKIPMLAYIAKDGLYSTKPLLTVELGKYEDSYTFCPDEFYQNGNYLILKCSNNIDFKFGRFSL